MGMTLRRVVVPGVPVNRLVTVREERVSAVAASPLPMRTALGAAGAAGAPVPVREGLGSFYRRRAAAQRVRIAREAAAAAPPATLEQVARALLLEGVTQRDLAATLGVSRSSVAETKRGRRQAARVRQWTIDVLTRHGELDAAPPAERPETLGPDADAAAAEVAG